MPVAKSVTLGSGVVIHHPDLVNLFGCTIGDNTKIGAFVEIQKNVIVGSRCKISSHTFICEGVTVEDDVFVGHGVMFINDRYPRATIGGRLQTERESIHRHSTCTSEPRGPVTSQAVTGSAQPNTTPTAAVASRV
jgi:UDP-2-acetamido-3-amino-2,3-dideoxy-glucuronate N-acetyltransferase